MPLYDKEPEVGEVWERCRVWELQGMDGWPEMGQEWDRVVIKGYTTRFGNRRVKVLSMIGKSRDIEIDLFKIYYRKIQ